MLLIIINVYSIGYILILDFKTSEGETSKENSLIVQ